MDLESRLDAISSKIDKILNEDPEEPLPTRGVEIRSLEFWRSVVAECLGSLLYVFFVCGVSIPWTGHFPPFLSVAFASAVIYAALTIRLFPGSHINPAFTISLAAISRVSPLKTILFCTAQAGGAIGGSAILFALTVPGYQGSLGATTIASHVSPIQAFGLELLLSFVLTLTFVAEPKKTLPVAAVLLAANLVALPCTGAGLNPIRSLGPAFVMNKWPSHWVFWLGPILGGLLAAYLHRFILRKKPKSKVREQPGDGDSVESPSPTPPTQPDRLLCERFEPIYGGTRSLYVKPSPPLPRQNLNRSQSVYQSKRFEKYDCPKINEGANKRLLPDANYESLYEQRHQKHQQYDMAAAKGFQSGPPSYDSNYCKTLERRERENQTNRIISQYNEGQKQVELSERKITHQPPPRSLFSVEREGRRYAPAGQSEKNYELIEPMKKIEPRVLAPERDSTYSRILEPLFNSAKPHMNLSPADTITFSYH